MIFKSEGEPNIKRIATESHAPEIQLTKINVKEYLKQSDIDALLRFRRNLFTNTRDDPRVPLDSRYLLISAQLNTCDIPGSKPQKDEEEQIRKALQGELVVGPLSSYSDLRRLSHISLTDRKYITELSHFDPQYVHNRVRDCLRYVTAAQRTGKNTREFLFWAKIVAPSLIPALTPELARIADIYIPPDVDLQTMPDSSLMYFAEEYAVLRVLDPSKKSPNSPLFWKRFRTIMERTKPDLSRLHYAFIAHLLQAEQISVDEDGLHIVDFSPELLASKHDEKPVPQRKNI